ncbi:MAG: metal-sensing transcriptional repressor [Kiritimatiellia bacterium]
MRTEETSRMLTIRLNRLIGQLNGIKKMIAEGVGCEDVLMQVNAVNGGIHRLSFLILEEHVRHCVREGIEHGEADETIENLAQALDSFSKII